MIQNRLVKFRELPVLVVAGTPDACGLAGQVRVDVEGGGGLAPELGHLMRYGRVACFDV